MVLINTHRHFNDAVRGKVIKIAECVIPVFDKQHVAQNIAVTIHKFIRTAAGSAWWSLRADFASWSPVTLWSLQTGFTVRRCIDAGP